jgi:hypothetical protein
VNDKTLKPRSKRRRWPIVCVLLFVVGITGWWHWPRGDARFVGRWRIFGGGKVCVWELCRNGSGKVTGQFGETNHFRWRVVDNRLELADGLPRWLRRASQSLSTAVQRQFGISAASIGGSYTLSNVTRDECAATCRDRGTVYLKRILE